MGRKKVNSLEDFEASENGQELVDVPVLKPKRGRTASKKIAEGLRAILEQDKKPIEIKHGHLNGLFCTYSYEHTVAQNATNDVKCKSRVLVHEDLPAAFARLNVHLAVICEEIHPDDIPDVDNLPTLNQEWEIDDSRQDPLAVKLARFEVASFRIAGNGENEGVVLTGQKLLSTRDHVQLTTPVTKFLSEYPFVNELRIAVDDVVKEIEAHMNGKQAPPRQQEMDFGNDGENEYEDEEYL